MTEHSAIAKISQSPDGEMFRRNSNHEVDVDRSLSNSSESSERSVVRRVTGEVRIQRNDISQDSCVETERERLSKYPDYCRTITIRGLTTLKCVLWDKVK